MFRIVACAAFAAFLSTAALADPAQDIVAGADRVRNPDRAFHLTSTTVEYDSGKPTDRIVFSVYSKPDPATRQFRDLVIYVDPPRDAGKMVLFRGNVLWFYDPASKDSIRIPPQQILFGQGKCLAQRQGYAGILCHRADQGHRRHDGTALHDAAFEISRDRVA